MSPRCFLLLLHLYLFAPVLHLKYTGFAVVIELGLWNGLPVVSQKITVFWCFLLFFFLLPIFEKVSYEVPLFFESRMLVFCWFCCCFCFPLSSCVPPLCPLVFLPGALRTWEDIGISKIFFKHVLAMYRLWMNPSIRYVNLSAWKVPLFHGKNSCLLHCSNVWLQPWSWNGAESAKRDKAPSNTSWGCIPLSYWMLTISGWWMLVVLTILKNMKVNGKDYPIYIKEHKTCLKPPTRYYFDPSIRIGDTTKHRVKHRRISEPLALSSLRDLGPHRRPSQTSTNGISLYP